MRQFLWLLPLGLMPGAALAWALLYPVQLRAARAVRSRPARIAIGVATLALFPVLAAAFSSLWMREAVGPMDILALGGLSAYSVFGIAIPWVFVTARSLSDESEKWWQASLLGAGVVFAGAVVWTIVGVLFNAGTD